MARRTPHHSVRTLFVSDLHLGTRGSQAEAFLEFLKQYEASRIYLVGDIVDGWRLKAAWFWPPAHNLVVQKLLRQARKGVEIVYIPGNHDEFLRDYAGQNFGGIAILEEAQIRLADGRKALILHGDKFDTVVRNARWLAFLGDNAYDFAIFLNRYLNLARRRLGMPYWSFSAAAKRKVKQAVSFIGAFEEMVAADARRQNAEVVICGHIHHASSRDIGGVRYMNCGDWVESRTAIAEHHDGSLEIIYWDDVAGKTSPVEESAAQIIQSAA